jgi:hypothetical protein
MKSFPSTLNESKHMYGESKAQSLKSTFDIDSFISGAINLNKSAPVIKEMLKQENINISNYQSYPLLTNVYSPNTSTSFDGDANYSARLSEKIYYENPLELPADVIALAKDYDWAYKAQVKDLIDLGEKNGQSLTVSIANTTISPSMFNPFYGVNLLGITRNTPLLNDIDDVNIDPKIGDCSIRTLCALSKNANSPLGQARYKYADFMYCKDLGKVSNNHLITLRKFAHPVGDHIFEMASPKFIANAGDYSFQTEGDVGRLITWFDTDDNKLEDICKYSYHATWKELNAQIEEQESKTDDTTTGIVGMIQNGFDPIYNDAVGRGEIGTHSIWTWLGSKLAGDKVVQGVGKNNGLLRNYDNNKVYTPKNTVQSTNIYEGKLEFSQEFTLNFSYQLRAYDNINPRSALLDLIGNILEVTYRRGKFWGGARKIIGPPQNMSAFNKTSAFIDNAFDKIGGFFNSLNDGSYNMNSIMGALTNGLNGVINGITNIAKGGGGELASAIGGYIKNIFDSSHAAEAVKGMFKNALGRPTLYAWQSLLSGDDTGLWHVTIGNPRNPIMAIGNLILTNATVTHSGPLGIDDFPSELKVSVTLKHARPRDITDIGRMYTKGASAIYHVLAHHKIDDFLIGSQGSGTTGTVEATGTGTSQNINDAYTDDVNKYKDNEFINYNSDALKNVSNPFLTSAENVLITRINNFSKTMYSVSLQEVA